MAEFCEELKAARTAARLSQHGMADRTLIPVRTIQKWEIGERTPPPYVQRFVLNELATLKKDAFTELRHRIEENKIDPSKEVEYFALLKMPEGNWLVLQPSPHKKEEDAKKLILEHQKANPDNSSKDYKVMARKIRNPLKNK